MLRVATLGEFSAQPSLVTLNYYSFGENGGSALGRAGVPRTPTVTLTLKSKFCTVLHAGSALKIPCLFLGVSTRPFRGK